MGKRSRRRSISSPTAALLLLQAVPPSAASHPFKDSTLASVFLPHGYPHSVTEDYAPYQIYDSLQALCSSVTGILSTRSILLAAGVGNAAASATSTTFNWVIRDGLSMVGRLVFAYMQGRDFDINAKTWRLMADILNDLGLCIEVFIIFFPPEWFLYLCSLASLLKSLCGVCAGATRASLTQHFSKVNNLADVSAKDGSQETAVNLVGTFLGGYVTSMLDDSQASSSLSIALFIVFTCLHLLFNFLAVKSVSINTFNMQRAQIFASSLSASSSAPIPTREQVARLERILYFEFMNPLRHVVVGANCEQSSFDASEAARALTSKGYFLRGKSTIYLLDGCDSFTVFRAYIHCCLLNSSDDANDGGNGSIASKMEAIAAVEDLHDAGWIIDNNRLHLNDHGYRVRINT